MQVSFGKLRSGHLMLDARYVASLVRKNWTLQTSLAHFLVAIKLVF